MIRLLALHERLRISILAAFAWLVPLAAHAETEPIRIEYRAVDGCPSVEDFRAQVFARTASARPAGERETARTFVVNIEATREGVVGSLVVRETGGATLARKVEGARCEQVATALSLATALAIDPQAPLTAPTKRSNEGVDGEPAPSGGADAPEPKAEPKAQPAAADPPPNRDAQRDDDRQPESPDSDSDGDSDGERLAFWTAALGPSLEAGISPRLALGASAQFERYRAPAGVPISAIGVEVTWLGGPAHSVSTASSSFQFLLARPFVCAFELPGPKSLHIGPCLGAELGAVVGSGADLPSTATETRFWAAIDASLRLRVEPRPSWFVELDGGLVLPLTRYTFVFSEPETQIYEVPAFAFAAGMRLGFRL